MTDQTSLAVEGGYTDANEALTKLRQYCHEGNTASIGPLVQQSVGVLSPIWGEYIEEHIGTPLVIADVKGKGRYAQDRAHLLMAINQRWKTVGIIRRAAIPDFCGVGFEYRPNQQPNTVVSRKDLQAKQVLEWEQPCFRYTQDYGHWNPRSRSRTWPRGFRVYQTHRSWRVSMIGREHGSSRHRSLGVDFGCQQRCGTRVWPDDGADVFNRILVALPIGGWEAYIESPNTSTRIRQTCDRVAIFTVDLSEQEVWLNQIRSMTDERNEPAELNWWGSAPFDSLIRDSVPFVGGIEDHLRSPHGIENRATTGGVDWGHDGSEVPGPEDRL